ncbi:hypothetical protein GQ55_6G278400 [Panicum hallii var. hallii]|uniref:Uncharacterized protein n=1 Tax=Panicum hallii var. hallii TaxID=1504633 RepID=A0A2T7DAC6_9POAL|nr:hypothetical protein GQ55_6G278400 [Panicum hallii var. hallii]
MQGRDAAPRRSLGSAARPPAVDAGNLVAGSFKIRLLWSGKASTGASSRAALGVEGLFSVGVGARLSSSEIAP